MEKTIEKFIGGTEARKSIILADILLLLQTTEKNPTILSNNLSPYRFI